MDSTRQSVIPIGPVISFTIAIVSLGLTSVITYHRATEPQKPQTKAHVFNIRSIDVTPIRLTSNAKTNRTVWEVVSSREFHAGLQRVEPGAWIPPHSHDTEEIVVVISGDGLIYDENGMETPLVSGTMVHMDKKSRHAIRNINSVQPLLLMWSFPVRFGTNKFEFRENYKIT